MEFQLIAILGLVVIIAAAIFSRRTGVATPLILVLVGLAVGMVPAVPDVRLEPEWVLAGILPPLLYATSVRMPVIDLRRSFGMITWLSVVLVVASAVVVGLVVHALFPAVPLPLGIALGAVVSPTDAVAATAIGKRLGLPPRIMTVLEGESLVNDASALVVLRTAIAAIAGTFSFGHAVIDFFVAVGLAIVVGVVLGWLSVWVRSRLDDPVITTAISFVVPFAAYALAEHLGASGVLAVVVAGLVIGHRGLRRLSARDRQTEETTWSTIQFLLENAVFGLMGLQLSGLLAELAQPSPPGTPQTVGDVMFLAAVVFGVLVLLRAAGCLVPWLLGRFKPNWITRKREHLATASERLDGFEPRSDEEAQRLQRVRRRMAMSAADLEFEASQPITGRGSVVIAWAGMRGVVTVAAAQTIPTGVPGRAGIVLCAFAIAVASLIIFGFTLPAVIRRLGVEEREPDNPRGEVINLMRDLVDDVSERLGPVDQMRLDGEPVDPAVAERFAERFAPFLADRRDELPPAPAPETRDQAARLLAVYLGALRDALASERAVGAYRTETYRKAQHILDKLEQVPPAVR